MPTLAGSIYELNVTNVREIAGGVCGIYFIFDSKRNMLLAGHSSNIKSDMERINRSPSDCLKQKGAALFSYTPCGKDDLDKKLANYIKQYNPPCKS